jgi:hypothetical protein
VTVSTAFKTSAFAADTADVWLVLLTISHASISPSVRVVNNTEAITSNGNEFIAFPFDLALPDSREDAPPRARLTIDNVSREIAQAIRSITSPPTVTIEIIRASAPDTIEASFPDFKLRNVTWDVGKVSGDLTVEDFTSEPYPAGIFSPASFPGLF